jgi:hypothetical protein
MMSFLEFDTNVDMPLFREYYTAHSKQLNKRKPRKYTFFEHLFIIFSYIGFGAAINFYSTSFTWPAFIITAIFFIFVYVELLYRDIRVADTIVLSENGLALGQHHYVFSDEGIAASGSEYHMHINWSQVTDTYEIKNAYIIQLDQIFAFIIRKSDISDMNELMQFVEKKINR